MEVISIWELQYFHQLFGEHHQDTMAHGRITQDEHDRKAYELENRQYELNDKLKRVIEADENYSITLITLLNICSRAPELFESSKVE